MILLEAGEIVAAVRGSLEAHVLPELPEGFARLQVIAALRALDEVADRLAHGDPIGRVNARLEQGLVALAAEIADGAPALHDGLLAMLAEAADVADPRERNRLLGERVTRLLESGDVATSRIRQVLEAESAMTSADDAPWMCPEAIESLQ